MIKYKRGDILQALKNGEIDVMAHGCNCRNKFGSGLAKQIAEQFPKVKEEYHDYAERNGLKLGLVIPVGVQINKAGNCAIVNNCCTQDSYGYAGKELVNYNAVEESLKTVFALCSVYKRNLGLPKIGCGLAGGNWDKVKDIYERLSKQFDYSFTVYEFKGKND